MHTVIPLHLWIENTIFNPWLAVSVDIEPTDVEPMDMEGWLYIIVFNPFKKDRGIFKM